MEAKASAKYLRGSAQKARLVIDMIRGKNVNQALAVLQFTNKRATDGIEACVRSAIANATEAAEKANIAVDPDELWVKEAFVDKGPSKGRRRMRPAPQGRAFREQRHYCHVTVLLSSDDKPVRAGNKAAKATNGDQKTRPKRTMQPTVKTRERRDEETITSVATTDAAMVTDTAPPAPTVDDTKNATVMATTDAATTTTATTTVSESSAIQEDRESGSESGERNDATKE